MAIDEGRWIVIDGEDGTRFDGWLVTPPASLARTTAPGLVLLQEIWGVNPHIRTVALQYALDGFVVLAPDVFWRQRRRVDLAYDEAGTKDAFAFMKGLDVTLADRDVAATVAALRAMDACSGQVASVGYCMGGMLAYRSVAEAGVDCAVAYYGGGIHRQLDLAPRVTKPIAFHFGGRDAHIGPEAVDAVRAAFAGRDDVRIDVYDDADHGFNCWGRPSHHRQAAMLAHGRTLAFLATHVR